MTATGTKSMNLFAAKLGVSRVKAAKMSKAVASAMKNLPDSSPIKKILQEAVQTGNEAKGKTLAEQLAPQTTALSGASAAVVSTGTQVAAVSSDRLSALRTGDNFAQRGFATGGHGLEKAFWLKPFGSRGKRSKSTATRKNVTEKFDGYSMAAKGLAVGVDAPVTDKVRVGTALAYSTSNIKGKGAGKDTTDVKSWQVSLYGDYSTDRYYVEGQLGFGRNDVSTASKVAFLTRKADYDTTSVNPRVRRKSLDPQSRPNQPDACIRGLFRTGQEDRFPSWPQRLGGWPERDRSTPCDARPFVHHCANPEFCSRLSDRSTC